MEEEFVIRILLVYQHTCDNKYNVFLKSKYTVYGVPFSKDTSGMKRMTEYLCDF